MVSSIKKRLNIFISPIGGTLTDTTTPGQSRPGSNGKEEVLHIPQSSRTRASLSDGSVSYSEHSFCRDALGVFYSPS